MFRASSSDAAGNASDERRIGANAADINGTATLWDSTGGTVPLLPNQLYDGGKARVDLEQHDSTDRKDLPHRLEDSPYPEPQLSSDQLGELRQGGRASSCLRRMGYEIG